ncbi:MAG: TolC family protein [Halarcobacter sp.]
MHLQKLTKLSLITILSFPFFLNAQENIKEENILSKDRLDLFKYSQEQNEQSSSKLKKDWINPITLRYSKTYGENYDTTKSLVSINQPIFKSGGIYNAIKYANATYDYNNVDIQIQKKELIKNAVTILFNLHILDLNIKKSEIQLKNAKIDIIRKKEQVLNGFLDTSYLDNAILEANKVKNTLVDLKYQKQELNYNFKSIASNDYKSFDLPKLKLNDEKSFIDNNLELKKANKDLNQKDYYVNMTVAKYLPTLNATMDYTKYHDTNNPAITDDTTQTYGLSVSMPIDVRTFNDIQTQKIEYLKAKLSLKNTILEEQNYYKTKLAKINMINEKKQIAKDDYKLYDSLLKIINEEKEAELKTQSDVDTLYNSQKIKAIELKIYKLQEQIELFDIYSKIG